VDCFNKLILALAKMVSKLKIFLARARYDSFSIPRPKGHGNYFLNLIIQFKRYRT